MEYREEFIGFDIREKKWDEEALREINSIRPLHAVYTRFTNVWPSRFREGGILAREIKENNYREKPSSPEYTLVPLGYSSQYNHFKLWDNLGSMLFRREYNPEKDIVAFFSVLFPIGQALSCKEIALQEIDEGKFLTAVAIPPEECLIALHPEEWVARGFDIGDQSGYSPFFYPQSFSSFVEEIEKNEQYTFWKNRNEYGLLTDFTKAVEECRIVNAYDWQDCPYFIWKVYEAVDGTALSLI